jgi:uncharacterized protein
MPLRALLPGLLVVSLHVYVGWRIVPDLPGGASVQAAGYAVLGGCFALISAGLIARLFLRGQYERLATTSLFVAGFFSSLFVLTLLRDVSLLIAWLALSPQSMPAVRGSSASLVAVLAAVVTAIGYAQARRRAAVRRVDIPLRGLPAALEGFLIAQISDIHVGPTIKRDYVTAIVNAVNALQADLVAVTGDVVDGTVEKLAAHTQPLADLKAVHGAFFVTGNHEYYAGERAWTQEFRRLGLRVLLNEHVVIQHRGSSIVIAGVTDFSSHQFNQAQRSDPAAALAGAPADAAAKVLLAHQPRSAAAAAAAGFDLQLSGHTHGGQFWPWTLFVRLQQPFTAGLHRLKNLWVYINQGTGYWGPPNRFGVPSEITLLRLICDNGRGL